MTAPERIWLSPQCDAEVGEQTFCVDPVYDDCEECGSKPTEYRRADLYTAQQETIAALVEALEWYEKHRLDAIDRAGAITAPEDEAVRQLCERHGYGAVMDSAARQWAKKPHGSAAFFVGGCIGDGTARDALARAKKQA